jgi:hypothetical protein
VSKAIIVSEGGHNSTDQNSGISVQSQSQSVPTSPRGGNTQTNMARIDNTRRLPELKGVGPEDPKQHLFIYETVSDDKNI